MSKTGKGSKSESHLEDLNKDKLNELIESNQLYGYREFCRILGIKILPSGSTSQFKQLKELSMICEYEKQNRKYDFIRMRTKDEIILYNERAIYSPLIEYIVSEKFCTTECREKMEDGILYLSMPELLTWTGMVNENYNIMRREFRNYQTRLAVHFINHQYGGNMLNVGDMKTFLNVSYQDILKPIMRDALKSMDNRKSITIQRGYKLFKEDDKGWVTYKNVLATSDEGKEILHICSDVFSELGIKKVQELYGSKRNLSPVYYDRCNELCAERMGYDGFYDCYAIIVDQIRTAHNMDILLEELNKRIRERIRSSKHLNALSVNSKETMIDSVIDLKTEYNFKNDMSKFYDEKGKVK